MRSTLLPAVGVFVLAGATALAYAQQITEPKTGTTFDAKIGMPGESSPSLRCTGVGVRTKFIIKVYGAGLYLEEATAAQTLASFKGASAATLQSSAEFYKTLTKAAAPKAIVMKFAREVGKDKIVEAYTTGLESTLGSLGASPVKADAQKFLGMFNEDAAEGSTFAIYGKGSVIHVLINGKDKGTVDNQQLAEAVFAIWLGPKPPNEDLKKNLVSQVDWALK